MEILITIPKNAQEVILQGKPEEVWVVLIDQFVKTKAKAIQRERETIQRVVSGPRVFI